MHQLCFATGCENGEKENVMALLDNSHPSSQQSVCLILELHLDPVQNGSGTLI
jgi:hypothetical protein